MNRKIFGIVAILLSYGLATQTTTGKLLSKLFYALFATGVQRTIGSGPTRKRWNFEMEVRKKLIASMHWANIKETRSLFGLSVPPIPKTLMIETVKIADNLTGEWITDISTNSTSSSMSKITILYLHGGAYCYLHPSAYRLLLGKISKALGGAPVFAPDYRLAPEHPFPAAVHDCVAAYHFLQDKNGINPKNIVLVGDSAGGGLVMATLLFLRDEQQNVSLPARAVCISPWIDLTKEPSSYKSFLDTDIFGYHGSEVFIDCARYYAGTHRLEDQLISPIKATSLSGLPPLLIQAGGCEQLLSNSLELSEKCLKDGVDATLSVYDDMFHDFQLLETHPDAKIAINEIVAFAKKIES